MTLYAPSTPFDTAMMFGHWELLIVFLLILIVFGAGKLPGVFTSLGEGVKNFKKSMRDDEIPQDKAERLPEAAPKQVAQQPQASDTPPKTEPVEKPKPADDAKD